MKVRRKKRMMPVPSFQVMEENSRGGCCVLSVLLVGCCGGMWAVCGWASTLLVARVSGSEYADGGGGSGFHKP